MSRFTKIFILGFCLSTALFITNSNKLEAAHGRWGAYDNERGAWGGNGGWWGENRGNWYGEYDTPGLGDGYISHDYYYDNNYPYGGEYNNGAGFGAGVDGAGLYFNFR